MNLLFKYLDDNNLFTSNWSGFQPGDSCIHQLLSITHEIYKAFDANSLLDVRGIFLKLIYKLKSLSICGNYYQLICSLLTDRHQIVVINGQSTIWSQIKARVPQGLILDRLLFSLYQ